LATLIVAKLILISDGFLPISDLTKKRFGVTKALLIIYRRDFDPPAGGQDD